MNEERILLCQKNIYNIQLYIVFSLIESFQTCLICLSKTTSKYSHSQDSHSQDSHSQDSHSQDSHSQDSHSQDSHSQDSHSQDRWSLSTGYLNMKCTMKGNKNPGHISCCSIEEIAEASLTVILSL